jgi:hypothetical protein
MVKMTATLPVGSNLKRAIDFETERKMSCRRMPRFFPHKFL